MLEVRNLSVAYGQHRALENVSIKIDKGEIVVILGANGAGKSTLLRAISGICEGQHSGDVVVDGHPILGLSSDRIVEGGVALVPEGRGIFGDLTVRENLVLGAYANRARDDEAANLERVMSLFPKLGERQNQIARTMSGGEQQMVAIGRAMMSNPQILMLDEPSLGLSPLLCKELFQSLTEVRKAGIGILLVEQNAKQSLAIADRGYLLENAHIVHEDSAQKLASDPAVQKAYLGAGGTASGAAKKGSAEKSAEDAVIADVVTRQPFRQRVVPRRNADDLLGQSVDALVASASVKSAPTLSRPKASSTAGSHEARLKTMIAEIETAAAGARQKRRLQPVRMQSPEVPVPKEPKKPVVVEVYRAPRVEVYRRREGSNEFERD
ncbi:ABC transporter ATP-binding protein [Actibacterium pelagium]|uniref:ABC transporter domain-containing protein n=1 Tax=Actibacterium pelagium TaxID=2029103 RepID=A0A917AEP6_9RHOB|nr:ABC transporter ATP-binding protein [Actibacterium pelagium]GGE43104.1 hypothetical protein GCM10011517_08430 [Actibacterium pelagium]